MREIVLIGGPNGAGKTTAARVLLPGIGIGEFVNADEIARGLSPLGAEQAALAAGRAMLARIHALVAQGTSFAFETTCSGRAYERLLRKCRAEGWRLTLVFLWLPSADLALDRVARRVREGGHAIPPEVVVRRFRAGLSNMMRIYLPLADQVSIHDNSDAGRVLIAGKNLGSDLTVHDRSDGPRSRKGYHEQARIRRNASSDRSRSRSVVALAAASARAGVRFRSRAAGCGAAERCARGAGIPPCAG
jgi:predicted ABC-type ATPase